MPDVLLTWVALRRLGPALKACGWTLLGALIGGAVMWGWGSSSAATARSVLDWVPAISPDMIGGVYDDLTARGAISALYGPLIGTPYKIYAVQAGASGVGLVAFLLVSIPARFVRFVVLAAATAGIAHGIGPRMSPPAKKRTLIVVWVAFYVLYFSFMPN